MIRNFLVASIIILMASCSSTRPVNSSATTKTSSKSATVSKPADTRKNDIKFLDQISSDPKLAATLPDVKTEQKASATSITPSKGTTANGDGVALRAKYASLLGKDADQLDNIDLLKSVDEWYGTKYKMGGTSKTGVDCSAFVQAVYLSAFGVTVPRTAFEQFKAAYHISATEMKEGDLVFFNTTGGVSHV